MKVNIQGECCQKVTAYGPTPECPQEIKVKGKNLFNGEEEWIMGNNISGFTIDNSSINCSDIRLNYIHGKEDGRMNKFLEIKEGQEINKINDKYFEERKSIIKNDKIYKILLKAEQEINEIYKEEDAPSRINISYLDYVTLESDNRIDKLKQEKDKKIEEVRKKYAEVAALVEDIPAKDRIEIYKEYGIM